MSTKGKPYLAADARVEELTAEIDALRTAKAKEGLAYRLELAGLRAELVTAAEERRRINALLDARDAAERDLRAQRDAAVEALVEAREFFHFHVDTRASSPKATLVNQGDINRLLDVTSAALALAKGGTR